MFRHFIAVLSAFAMLALTGCANQQLQNAGAGAGIGAVAGALLGDSRHAARTGAVIGGVVGAFAPIQGNYGQQQYSSPGLPPGLRCPNNSFWDGRGCQVRQGYVQQQFVPAYQQQMAPVYQGGRNPFNPSACPSGAQMRNNRWVCMD